MNKLKCTECGHIFDDNLKECPNCGCPANECETIVNNTGTKSQNRNNVFVDSQPQNSTDPKYCRLTCGYYQPWYNILQPWYVACTDLKEQHRFDQLNEFLLLGNLLFRITLWWILFFWIAAFCFMTIILIPLGFYVIIKFFPWAVARYWATIHKLWRRISQRFWISMESTRKTGMIEELK